MYGKDNLMYDLHGMSENQAAGLVERVIRETSASISVRIRFVTGRGNHVNSKGQRGTLFTQFPEWLKQTPYADRIEKVSTFDGHYEVSIKPTLLDNSFQAKVKQFNKKFYADHIDNIRGDADRGNPEAMVLYGQLIESGEYGAQDVKITAAYFKKAAEAGYPEGMHEYARCWLHGIGVRQNDEKAKEWLTKASNKGFIPSTVTLAKSYANALPGYPRDLNEAIRLHTICAEAGETDSMRFFGSHYSSGRDIQSDLATAFSWYMRAAERNDAKAQFNVAVMCAQGRGTKVDIEKSEKYFKLAAYNGDVDAQFIHGMKLFKSADKKIKDQGITWLFAAADNGCERANEVLGTLLPPEEAKDYLARSAQAGNFISQRKLNILNGQSEDFGITLEAIIAKYKVLTENDIMHMSQQAKYFLLDKILLYAQAEDKRSAFSIIKDMADHDCPDSLRREAYFYARGDAVLEIKKTPERVLALLKRAADVGDPISAVQLAKLYLKKTKDPKHIAEAKKLLRAAGEKKYPPAFYELGLLYHNGAYGEDNKHHAVQCFQSAVKYEKMKDHLQHFVLGPLDEYESVAPKAQQLIDQITAAGRVVSKPAKEAPPPIISAGFFNNPPRSAPAPASVCSPKETSSKTSIPARSEQHTPPSIPNASMRNNIEKVLPAEPEKNIFEHPNQDPPLATPPPQPADNAWWSFFSSPAVVLAVSAIALTTLAFK